MMPRAATLRRNWPLVALLILALASRTDCLQAQGGEHHVDPDQQTDHSNHEQNNLHEPPHHHHHQQQQQQQQQHQQAHENPPAQHLQDQQQQHHHHHQSQQHQHEAVQIMPAAQAAPAGETTQLPVATFEATPKQQAPINRPPSQFSAPPQQQQQQQPPTGAAPQQPQQPLKTVPSQSATRNILRAIDDRPMDNNYRQPPAGESHNIPTHNLQQQQQQQQQPPPPRQPQPTSPPAPANYPPASYSNQGHYNYPLYFGHNPFIEILKPHSYADDNIVTLNLSHSHIYEIDSDAFVGQRFEHIDLSNNKLGLIHSRSFRIGPNHSKHNPYNPNGNGNSSISKANNAYPTRRPPPTHPKSVTIDFSHNPAIVALSGAFDHIDVPNCLLNFTNSTVELKFGAFKKYFKEHPGHIVDIESVDCCEQEWLLGYKHNFVLKTHCDHDPGLLLSKVPQQTIIDSCIAYVTRARHSMTIQGPSVIHQVAAAPRGHSSSHVDNQYLTYVILGGTAMILTSLSIYIIFYMFSLKAAFVYQMQRPPTSNQHKS